MPPSPPGPASVPDEREPFRRDASTVVAYSALASYAFWLYAFGPALALLQAELHFSYTVLGGYSALWSGGAALAGAGFAHTSRRIARAPLLWWSGLAAAAGALLFVSAHSVALTMLGAFVMGFAGTTMLTLTQAILSDRHGERRDQALVEANVGAGVCAVLAPLILGLFEATPAGWRAALALPALALVALYLRARRLPLPQPPALHLSERSVRLPLICWLFALLVAVGIAVEFCVVYFGAELLTGVGVRTADAATAMSSFYLGILAGRVGGAVLIRRTARSVSLLWASLAVTAAGFAVFWLAGLPAVAVTGLFVCGLGVANLYPLSLALALAAAPEHGDRTNARIQLLGGLLVIAAPYLLGTLADRVGLTGAFAIEPGLIAVSALLLLVGLRAAAARDRMPSMAA